ncbi:hypothetical protein [Succinimonas amylolytica]|uniref:hypothetical protein n=1 Tax=Succinimonas amylolytica TaxID=83769 RepID=UPI00036A76CB|nr:hypothetical protein [Succinimonas amylolytica]
MATKLYKLNLDVLGKLIESEVASQNFVESVINDLPESKVSSISDVQVGDLSSSRIAASCAEGYDNINGVVFSCKIEGKPAEVILINEGVSYLTFWHDMSFFSYKLFRQHSQVNDGVRRYLTFVITDMDVKANKFHTISHFNDKNGFQADSFQIHYVVIDKQTGNEDSMLENWIRALVAEDAGEDGGNVSSISEAYRVA